MRFTRAGLALVVISGTLGAQAPGHFPPDSLINTKVFPHNTPVNEVIGAMRTFSGSLGVRCQFCHVGEEGMPLERFDFAKDEKRPKLVARQMMRMVQEINHRLDTIPGRTAPGLQVTCATCQLCSRMRSTIIGFPAIGGMKNDVKKEPHHDTGNPKPAV